MMARDEAIAILQEKYDYCKSFYDLAARPKEDYPEMAKYLQALQIALSALRPVSRGERRMPDKLALDKLKFMDYDKKGDI